MKRIIKNCVLLSIAILTFSCSDEFINEKLDVSGVAISAVIISPEWETDDYQFQCEGTGNADFIVENKPEWLSTNAVSGKFVNSIATIRGKAITDSHFSSTGIYIDQMIVKSGGKKYAVPVYYITEGDPAIQVNRTFELSYNSDNQLHITNSGNGILLWDIVSVPDWITVNIEQFNMMSMILGKDAFAKIPFVLDFDKASQKDSFTGTIVIKTNDRNNPLLEIDVRFNMGTPQLNIYYLTPFVLFNTQDNSQPLTISNIGDGILAWHFDELPEWLTVSKSKGILNTFSNEDIVLTCDYNKLLPGLNTDTFWVKTNDIAYPSYPVVVKARIPGNSESIRSVKGNIVDVAFNKLTNTLYYVTSQPSQLVIYDLISKNIEHEVALSEAPNCLAVSEDYTKAAIGHEGMITAIDLDSYAITGTFEFDYSIYDIEWANDDWFCYTQNTLNTNEIKSLFWLNTKSKEVFETTSANNWLGTGNLKKVPGLPYIIGSRRGVSPSGIFVYDIDTKTRKSFVHSSIDKIWFIDEGNLIIDSYSNIIETHALTSATGNDLNPPINAGELKIGEFQVSAWWVEHSVANHSIWAMFSYAPYNYFPLETAAIYQFEDNDFKLINTYYYDNFYQPIGHTSAFEVEAHYLFANNEGTELTVLRKGKDNNNWSIEFIPVQ